MDAAVHRSRSSVKDWWHYDGSDTRAIPTGPASTEGGGVPWWVLLRDGRFKYIRTLVSGETEELYDLDGDPEELHITPARKKVGIPARSASE